MGVHYAGHLDLLRGRVGRRFLGACGEVRASFEDCGIFGADFEGFASDKGVGVGGQANLNAIEAACVGEGFALRARCHESLALASRSIRI